MKIFKFSLINKTTFYLYYFYYKLLVPFEVKEGKLNIFITEVIWVTSKFFKFNPFIINKLSSSYYETKFGKFFITPDLISTIAVSPSFERREINLLLKLIGKELKNKKKVLFIDVGAFFGLYTIVVGNKFKKNRKLEIITFEPGTNYLSLPTNELLKNNVRINKLKNVKLYNFGLGEKNIKKNAKGIKIKKLDSVLNDKQINKYDSVFIKIDVDGDEKKVLEGALNLLKLSKPVTLLIEDFVDIRIVSYLKKDFKFIAKPSVYNSFWIKNEKVI